MGALVYLLFFPQQTGRMQVERIDVKDKTGHPRVVISNQDLIPPPLLGGKTFERQVTPAGLIFYDEQGNERGGIALSRNNNTHINALAFDYSNADAVGLVAIDETDTEYYKSGLIINQKDPSGKIGANINRINLITENGNAGLEIKDEKEVVRLRLEVDSLGTPSVKLFDAQGKPGKTLELN